MLALERQKIILEMLANDGFVSVGKLSQLFEVTEETIRRDLEKLEKQEALTRTHGGAVSIDKSSYELSLEKRKNANSGVKEKLAKEAAKLIISGDTIFLDASTTTFFMAKEIKKMKNITVITNSLRVIDELSTSKNIKVIAIGGRISINQSFTGSISEDIIKKYFFADKFFFSSKGITQNAGILESNEFECSIKKQMIANSSQKIYICDNSKIGRIGCEKLCDFDNINAIITDANFENSFMLKLKDCNVSVINI